MRAAFDWKPLLAEGEVVLWEGRPPRLKIFVLSAVLTAVAIAGWMLALAEVAQAPGGSECFTDDCPTADRKSGFVAFFAAPVSLLICGGMMVLSPFMRQASAITSERVLSFSRPMLRKQPRFEQIPIKGAAARLDGISALTTVNAFGPHPSISYVNQSVVLRAKSKAELKRAITLIEQLSSEDPPA